jgi:spore coat polysaccharide biosynthesis protein SpsF
MIQERNIDTEKSIDKRVVAIIEARMTSTRLPGKVLLPVCGKPLLAHQIERLGRALKLDDIMVATTTNAADEPIAELAESLGVKCFRGSEEDVLGRVLGAAEASRADIIVEITGDCPAIDPGIVEEGIESFLTSDVDYVENIKYPGGMNYAVFATDTLTEVELVTRDDMAAREHVSLPIYENPEKYKLMRIEAYDPFRREDICIELDEPSDYEMIKRIFESLYPDNPQFTLTDILAFFKLHPEILKLNDDVRRKTPR